MAELGTTIDPNNTEPARQDFALLPDGEYPAQIIESSVHPTKNGRGTILDLTWEIVDGELQNRKFWQNITFQHEVAQTQSIGQGQIKNICDAIGFDYNLSDSEVLHFKPCRVRVGKSKPQTGYDVKNEVKAVKPYGAATPPASKAAAQPGQAQPPKAATPAAKPAGATSAAKPAGATSAAKPTGPRPWAKTA